MNGPSFCIVKINGISMRGAKLYREVTTEVLGGTWDCVETLHVALTQQYLYTQFDGEDDVTWHIWCWHGKPIDEPIDLRFALAYDNHKERINAYLEYPELLSTLKVLSLVPNDKEPV